MKTFKVVGLLFALLIVGATSLVAVAAASAETAEWLCANALAAKECLILSENLTVMQFQDRNSESAVECAVGSILNEGWAGPGAEDEITSIVFHEPTKECKASAKALNLAEVEVINKCKKFESIGAIHVPWKTDLELISGVAWDTLLPGSGTLQPGYEIMCETIVGLITDTC